MIQVFYLCKHPALDGLVFPSELPGAYYAPGYFAVSHDPELPFFSNQVSIKAIDVELELDLTASLDEGSTYRVDHGGRVYYFAPFGLPYMYVGRSRILRPDSRLYAIEPVNTTVFDAACVVDQFYFVGTIDNELPPEAM